MFYLLVLGTMTVQKVKALINRLFKLNSEINLSYISQKVGLKCIFPKLEFSSYAPNFEEVEGTYWYGPLRLSVHYALHTVKNVKR